MMVPKHAWMVISRVTNQHQQHQPAMGVHHGQPHIIPYPYINLYLLSLISLYLWSSLEVLRAPTLGRWCHSFRAVGMLSAAWFWTGTSGHPWSLDPPFWETHGNTHLMKSPRHHANQIFAFGQAKRVEQSILRILLYTRVTVHLLQWFWSAKWSAALQDHWNPSKTSTPSLLVLSWTESWQGLTCLKSACS